MRKLYITLFFLYCSILFGQQKEYKLDEIIVSTGKTPLSLSNFARSVFVITSDEIRKLPANNVIDILKHISSIDIKTRGAEGIQADAGIRGGTFEQTLILIDGIKIIDPQTGHHNLNIPITPDNIERIEILKGQGARIFGPNAFGGAINFITKKGGPNSLSLSTLAGQNKLYELGITGSYSIKEIINNLTISRKKSDGYTYNTNFEITNFSWGANYSTDQTVTNLLVGYVDKKFGANNFYSDLYPDQWEHTTTKIANLSSAFNIFNSAVIPKFYWRRNDDDYILDNKRPEWYRNQHQTDSYGAELQLLFESVLGKTSLSGEIGKEEISSTNLSNHNRSKGGIFLEHILNPLDNLFISTGLSAYKFSSSEWKFWPGFDISYNISFFTKVYGSYGIAFRIPTFTELYYVSPANLGNPNLKNEETANYEIGLVYNDMFIEGGLSIFYKDGNNIIDWVRPSVNTPWKVENVTSINTIGTEINFSFSPSYIWFNSPFTKFGLNYTYLSSDRRAENYESKYLLDHLRHQLHIELSHHLIFGITQNWSIRYQDRNNYGSLFIADSQLRFLSGGFDIFLRATNILNKKYQDFPGVNLPGRWISAGMKYSLQY